MKGGGGLRVLVFLDATTTFTIEMSPPIYFHYAGSIQPILKNKKSFKNYEKLSNQLWNPHLSNCHRLKLTEV